MKHVPIHMEYLGVPMKGEACPVQDSLENGVPTELMITLNGRYLGILACHEKGWTMNKPIDPDFVESLGNYIVAWYE